MARPVARSSTRGRSAEVDPAAAQCNWSTPRGSDQWLHEIKFDGYRLHCAPSTMRRSPAHPHRARLDAQISRDRRSRGGARSASGLSRRRLCGIAPRAFPSFSRLQAASDVGSSAGLVFTCSIFCISTRDDVRRPAVDRPQESAPLLAKVPLPSSPADHHLGNGPAFYDKACELPVEGVVFEARGCALHAGNRGFWRKSNACTARKSFIVAGPSRKGRRPWLGAVLLPITTRTAR